MQIKSHNIQLANLNSRQFLRNPVLQLNYGECFDIFLNNYESFLLKLLGILDFIYFNKVIIERL